MIYECPASGYAWVAHHTDACMSPSCGEVCLTIDVSSIEDHVHDSDGEYTAVPYAGLDETLIYQHHDDDSYFVFWKDSTTGWGIGKVEDGELEVTDRESGPWDVDTPVGRWKSGAVVDCVADCKDCKKTKINPFDDKINPFDDKINPFDDKIKPFDDKIKPFDDKMKPFDVVKGLLTFGAKPLAKPLIKFGKLGAKKLTKKVVKALPGLGKGLPGLVIG